MRWNHDGDSELLVPSRRRFLFLGLGAGLSVALVPKLALPEALVKATPLASGKAFATPGGNQLLTIDQIRAEVVRLFADCQRRFHYLNVHPKWESDLDFFQRGLHWHTKENAGG